MRRTVSRAVRSLAMVAVVLAGALAILAMANAAPGLLTASTQERRFATVEEAERAWRHRLLVPAYFPAVLAWPPSTIRAVGRPPRVLVLGFSGRDGGQERLFVAQTEEDALPEGLLPGGVVMGEGTLTVAGVPAKLTRLLADDGGLWQQLTWTRGGRTLLLRSRGSEEQLFRMASSLPGGRP
jgi:hypothetical protein